MISRHPLGGCLYFIAMVISGGIWRYCSARLSWAFVRIMITWPVLGPPSSAHGHRPTAHGPLSTKPGSQPADRRTTINTTFDEEPSDPGCIWHRPGQSRICKELGAVNCGYRPPWQSWAVARRYQTHLPKHSGARVSLPRVYLRAV